MRRAWMTAPKQKRKCGIDYWPIIYVLPVIIACVMLSCSCGMLPDEWQDQIPDGDDGTVTPDPTTTTTTQPPVVPPPVVPTPPATGYTITKVDADNVWWSGPDFGWGPNGGYR